MVKESGADNHLPFRVRGLEAVIHAETFLGKALLTGAAGVGAGALATAVGAGPIGACVAGSIGVWLFSHRCDWVERSFRLFTAAGLGWHRSEILGWIKPITDYAMSKPFIGSVLSNLSLMAGLEAMRESISHGYAVVFSSAPAMTIYNTFLNQEALLYFKSLVENYSELSVSSIVQYPVTSVAIILLYFSGLWLAHAKLAARNDSEIQVHGRRSRWIENNIEKAFKVVGKICIGGLLMAGMAVSIPALMHFASPSDLAKACLIGVAVPWVFYLFWQYNRWREPHYEKV
jgi:hypothetical protein